MLTKILQRATKEGAVGIISGEFEHTHILEVKDGIVVNQNRKRESVQFKIRKEVSPQTEKHLNKIIRSMRGQGEFLDISIEKQSPNDKKINQGMNFPNYGEFDKLFEEGKASISAEKGQVLLIDIWGIWCGPCQEPMQHNQDMLRKNNWGNQVRIVALNIDEDRGEVIRRVVERGWDLIEHVTLGGWKEQHKLIRDFSVKGIPFVCLVDTDGIVSYVGHPRSINLEERIQKLLGGGKKEQNLEIESEQAEAIIQTLSNETFFRKQFGKASYLQTILNIQQKFEKGKVTAKAKINLTVHPEDTTFFEVYEKYLPSKSIEYHKKIADVVEIPHIPPLCASCPRQINYPLYFCLWNHDFRCRNCVEKSVQKEHGYYSFKNNSILLMGPTKWLPRANLGTNIQPENIFEITEPHHYLCNSCGLSPLEIGRARYICVNCCTDPGYDDDYCDYCDECMSSYLSGDEEVVKSMQVDGHKRTHAYLRILFKGKSYNEF